MKTFELAQDIAAAFPNVVVDPVSDYAPLGTGAFLRMKEFEGVTLEVQEEGYFCELVDFDSGDTYCAHFETEAEARAFITGCYISLTK